MSNLDFWNEVSKTDPAHTKKAKIGQMNITAICPQYQRKNATEAFGMYGDKWGIVAGSESYQILDFKDDNKICLYTGTFFYYNNDGKFCDFPISSNIKVQYVTNNGKGYLKVDDEFAKKAQTDALTKGLSFLGFNSDIFEGLFDDNKYLAERTEEAAMDKHNDDVIKQLGKETVDEYQRLITTGDVLGFANFMANVPPEDPSRAALLSSWPKGQKTKMKNKQIQMQADARPKIEAIVVELGNFITTGDEQGITEIWDQLGNLKKFVMPHLTEDQCEFLKNRKAKKEEA